MEGIGSSAENNRKNPLEKNIPKNYLFTLLENLDFTQGIWMIYMASKGMSLTQLGLIETIYHVASFSMEVPTGVIADVFGRKLSRTLGRIAKLVSILLIVFAGNFWGFGLAFVFSALSNNLESGAGDALIYDSLKEIGKEETYMKVNGRKEIFFQTAGMISFLVGGYLATKSYSYSYGMSVTFAIFAIIQSITFKEPSVGRLEKSFREEVAQQENVFFRQIRESIKVIKSDRKIGALILYINIFGTLCVCIFFYLQNFLKAAGWNEAKIGLTYAVASMMAGIVATQVHKIGDKLGAKGILIIVPIITVLCIFGMLTPYHYLFFIVLTITESIIFVSSGDYLNKMIPSETRATVLSFSSMVFSFMMILVFPCVGFIGDHFSLQRAFLFLGGLGAAFVIGNMILLLKKEA